MAPAPELNYFATEGIPPMVEALDRLAARGTPLKIGLFLDTTIMNDEDLTTERGKRIFYASIRDYYSRIPPRHWAAIGGRPLVWLYDAQRVYRFDQSTFDYVYRAVSRRTSAGCTPYIVRELQWERTKNVRAATSRSAPMASTPGAPRRSGSPDDPKFTVAAGRARLLQRPVRRPDGSSPTARAAATTSEQLGRRSLSGRQILAVETWNELGEASGILETVEFGRQYIDLTRRYADRFKAGLPPP